MITLPSTLTTVDQQQGYRSSGLIHGEQVSTASLLVDPDSPWQNAWIESFNGRLRDELLNSGRFDSLLEARVIIEDLRRDYNANRPHTAHGTEFALQ